MVLLVSRISDQIFTRTVHDETEKNDYETPRGMHVKSFLKINLMKLRRPRDLCLNVEGHKLVENKGVYTTHHSDDC